MISGLTTIVFFCEAYRRLISLALDVGVVLAFPRVPAVRFGALTYCGEILLSDSS